MCAVVWWLYVIIYGLFPLSFSTDLYHLFIEINGPSVQYWLFVIVVPPSCLLPSFFIRSLRR